MLPFSEVLIYRKLRSQSNGTQQRLQEIEEFIDKRVRLFIPLHSSLEHVRLIARSIYKSYVFYNPEIRLVQCMYRYARTEYPEIVDMLRMDEFGRSGHTAYRTFVLITDNLLKYSAMGLQIRQGKRDTSKISPDSTNDRLRKRSTGPLNLGPSAAQPLFQLRIKTEPKEPLAVAATRNGPVSMGNPSAGSLNTAALLENSSIASATNTLPEKQSPDPFERFNMEHYVLRSFGLDPESIKEWTPMYCWKEYVKDFLRRFTYTVILA